MFAKNPNKVRFAFTVLRDDEVEVVGHRAFNLSEYDELRRQGKPISVSSAENMYYDGDDSNSFDLPLMDKRGVDINDLWNESKDTAAKMSKLKLSSVEPLNKV